MGAGKREKQRPFELLKDEKPFSTWQTSDLLHLISYLPKEERRHVTRVLENPEGLVQGGLARERKQFPLYLLFFPSSSSASSSSTNSGLSSER